MKKRRRLLLYLKKLPLGELKICLYIDLVVLGFLLYIGLFYRVRGVLVAQDNGGRFLILMQFGVLNNTH